VVGLPWCLEVVLPWCELTYTACDVHTMEDGRDATTTDKMLSSLAVGAYLQWLGLAISRVRLVGRGRHKVIKAHRGVRHILSRRLT
jgi:hypothetical protein